MRAVLPRLRLALQHSITWESSAVKIIAAVLIYLFQLRLCRRLCIADTVATDPAGFNSALLCQHGQD